MDTLICLVCGEANDGDRRHCIECSAELGTSHTVPASTVAMEPDEDNPRPATPA
jgi:hypothetical protein